MQREPVPVLGLIYVWGLVLQAAACLSALPAGREEAGRKGEEGLS